MKIHLQLTAVLMLLVLSVFAQTENNKTGNQTIAGCNSENQIQNPKSVNVLCDTLFSFPTVETWPAGLAWDGTNLWLTSHDVQVIRKISPSGVVLGSIPSPSNTGVSGGGLDFDGVDLWAVVEQENMLYRINAITGTVKRQFTLPAQGTGDPNGWGIAYDGKNMWYSQYLPPILFKMDTATGIPLATYNLPSPIISIHAVNGKLYGINVLSSVQKLYRFNMLDGTLIDSTEWCIPYPLGLTWDGTNLWNVSSMTGSGGYQRVFKIGPSILNDIDNLPVQRSEDVSNIFPNPVAAIFEIETPLNARIQIMDIQGRVIEKCISTEHKTQIRTEYLSAGIYFVKIDSEKATQIKKFVKQ